MKNKASLFILIAAFGMVLGGCFGAAGGNTKVSDSAPVIKEGLRIVPMRYTHAGSLAVSYLSSEQFLLCRRKDSCPIERKFTPAPLPLKLINPVAVEPKKRKLDMPLRAVVHFPSGNSTLQPDDLNTLDDLARNLKEEDLSSIRIVIAGYTDSIGSMEANRKLAKDRAEAVASYLRDNGIVPKEVVTGGRSLCCYITTNVTAEDRAKNRRAEIWVEPFVEANDENSR